ncbi:peptidoglycan-binding protein [Roseibium aggregatum]|uniref:Peptidoglycan-binding protein n=1 Tax=Roseibium aggregatum TaxID=187304 RepID=A0A939ED98_9HYPH|nr:peptidoglycan-binding protein [Roseibium aggregatum]MBN9671045.1 peptidoglycan-binding protein [Roseibium aggregatum]
MKKFIASVAILGMVSAAALTSKPAHAGSGGAAIAGGIVGFAAGAIVGSQLAKNRGHRGGHRRGSYRQSGSGLALQRDLATLGFDPGPLDGRPGAQTNAALVAYQQTYGEVPDATLTASERRLLSARAMMVTMPSTYGDRTYWRHVQASLYLNGFDAGSFDGRPGRKTQNAIQQYQFRNNYVPTGQLTPDQSQALLASAHDSVAVASNAQPAWATPLGGTQPNPPVASLPASAVEPDFQDTIGAAEPEQAPESVFDWENTDQGGETTEARAEDIPDEDDTVSTNDAAAPTVTASQTAETPAASTDQAGDPKIHVDADGKPYIVMKGVKFYIQAAPDGQSPASPDAPAGNDNADLLTAKTVD